MTAPDRPTCIRSVILALTVCVAVLLYLDRFCLSFVINYIREDLRLTSGQTGFLLGAFFLTYAFGQIPGGWLSDRYGTRMMLAFYLAVWSVLTGLMGLATSFIALLLFRFGCGLFEAGAYPACAGLIRRWIPYEQRGLASGIVSIGGRIGGAVAPAMTAYLMVVFMPVSTSSLVTEHDLLDPRKLARDVLLIPEKNKERLPTFSAGSVGLMGSPLGQGPLLAAATIFSGASDKKVPAVLFPVAYRLQEKMSADKREQIQAIAAMPDHPAKEESSYFRYLTALFTSNSAPKSREETEGLTTLRDLVNDWLKQPDLLDGIKLSPIEPKLNGQALGLLKKKRRERSEEEVTRLNRLLMEVLFPDSIRKLYGDSWQPVLVIYGMVGVFFAVVFFAFYRNTPRQHFLTNEAEALLDEAHETAAAEPTMPARILWKGILTNVGLWASSIVQFGTNFGWIFPASLLPLYLTEVHQVPEETRGAMASLPFLISLPMMIAGGRWTDWMTKKFGLRIGRCFPIASTRFLTGFLFVVCWTLNAPWPIVIVLCILSVVNDMGIPSLWAYNLDVGRANVGLVLGWGNMWGNLGAFVSPILLLWLRDQFADKKAGYDAIFLTCAGVFIFIGIVALFIDATKPIGVPRGAK